MPSERRLTPHNTPIKATNRRREVNSSPSPYSPEYEGLNPDDTERPISLSTLKKDKWQRGDSPPLPPSPEEYYRSMRRPSASPLPRGKRRRSSSPPRPQSKRLIRYNDLYPSRSRSTSGSSRTIQSSRPGKIYTCDNYGCGGQHSLDHCPLPMRCRGCGSKRQFQSACTEVCVHCGHTGHNVTYCCEFVVDRNGRSRPLDLSRYYARERQQRSYKHWDRPQDSANLRSDSLQRYSTQPFKYTRLSSLEPTDPPPKSSQRLAFEEEESTKQARHKADMARKAAAQKLELDHEVRLLEVRRQYAAGSLSFNTTPSSVLYPPYDPNGPLEIPDMVFMKESLPVHAAALVDKQRGRDGDGGIKREKEINYEVID